MRVVGRVAVGTGAHHLAVSPNGRRAWVALGETANTIVVVDVADPRHMRVLQRLHPAAQAHDIAFDPDGRTVWVSSASQPYISVYRAASGRLLDTVPAGRAPQHVLFAAGHAYVTSGYGSSIEMVDPARRTVVRRVELPYGSFNLASAGRWLVATSVLNGEVTVLRAATLRRRAQTTAPRPPPIGPGRSGTTTRRPAEPDRREREPPDRRRGRHRSVGGGAGGALVRRGARVGSRRPGGKLPGAQRHPVRRRRLGLGVRRRSGRRRAGRVVAHSSPSSLAARVLDTLEVDDATLARSRGAAVNQACSALPYYMGTYPLIVERSWHKLVSLGVQPLTRR